MYDHFEMGGLKWVITLKKKKKRLLDLTVEPTLPVQMRDCD